VGGHIVQGGGRRKGKAKDPVGRRAGVPGKFHMKEPSEADCEFEIKEKGQNSEVNQPEKS